MGIVLRFDLCCMIITTCCEIAKNLHENKLLTSDSIKFVRPHLDFIKSLLAKKTYQARRNISKSVEVISNFASMSKTRLQSYYRVK
jgi:hypothetical protein